MKIQLLLFFNFRVLNLGTLALKLKVKNSLLFGKKKALEAIAFPLAFLAKREGGGG